MNRYCYIEFSFSHRAIFQRIKALFDHVKEMKKDAIQIKDFEQDIALMDFFTEEELNYFWWPTAQESKKFWEIYSELPVEQRLEHVQSVPWDYDSVFAEIGVGDYQIVGCKKRSEQVGRLEFDPIGFPYGGNEPLQEAIKSFGARILEVHG